MENTLREVCTAVNVSRRAVQGYEKAGLVSATGHNNRGYLLYDEDAQKRIADIRMYQDFGFSIKEIVQIIDAPDEVLKAALVNQLKRLKERQSERELVIQRMCHLIQRL